MQGQDAAVGQSDDGLSPCGDDLQDGAVRPTRDPGCFPGQGANPAPNHSALDATLGLVDLAGQIQVKSRENQ